MSLMKPRKRNLLLADAMRDDTDPEIDVTEDEAETEILPEPIPEPLPEPIPAPPSAPASFSMTAADLQAMITAAVTAAASGNAALADAVTQGIANSREPIPENKIDPGIITQNIQESHYLVNIVTTQCDLPISIHFVPDQIGVKLHVRVFL